MPARITGIIHIDVLCAPAMGSVVVSIGINVPPTIASAVVNSMRVSRLKAEIPSPVGNEVVVSSMSDAHSKNIHVPNKMQKEWNRCDII